MKQKLRIFCISLTLLLSTTIGVSAFSSTVDKDFIQDSVDLLVERIVSDGYYSQAGKYTISYEKIYNNAEESAYLGVDDYGALSFSYYYVVNGDVVESVNMNFDLPYSSYVQPDVTIFYESPYYLGAKSNFDASEYEWDNIVSFSQTKGTDFSKSFVNRECSELLSEALAFWNEALLNKADLCLANIGFTSLCDDHDTDLINVETATCTKDGYTGDEMCFICGEIVNTGEVIPASHKYGAYKTTKKAKFGAKGVQTATCKNCSATVSKSITAPKTIKLSTTTYTYNGKIKKPTVTVYNSAGQKISSSNYTVSYASGCKNVGKYKVTVTFKNSSANYSGSKYTTFKINPAAKSISKLTPSKKAFTVKWSKPSSTYRKQMSGYQIQYSTSSKMTNATKVTVKSTTATSKKISGSKVKAKKTYYVQLRTYKKIGSSYYYSGWSKVKKVKTK